MHANAIIESQSLINILIGDLTNAIKAEQKAHQPFVTMEMKASCGMRV